MKIYEIYDEENSLSIGTLLYYSKEKTFIIELQDYLDEWTAPLLMTSYVKKGIFTIPSDTSFIWVRGRIIPSNRQNISSILKTHGLKEYDEMAFLEISEGKCCQDSMYIRKLTEIPEYVSKRAQKNIIECYPTGENQLLCFFADDTIKKIDLTQQTDIPDIDKIIKNKLLFESVKIGAGGYCITFNDSIEISARVLIERGETIPLTVNDFMLFLKNNVVDTSESCVLLECSRQNLSYMVKEKYLKPIKENVKGNLYLKGDVIKNKW